MSPGGPACVPETAPASLVAFLDSPRRPWLLPRSLSAKANQQFAIWKVESGTPRDKKRDVRDETRDVRDATRDVRNGKRDVWDETRDVWDETRDVRDETRDVWDGTRDVWDKTRDVRDETRDAGADRGTQPGTLGADSGT